jgi:hypothetical protein
MRSEVFADRTAKRTLLSYDFQYYNIKKPVQETIKEYIDKSLSPNFQLSCAVQIFFF